MAADNPAVTDEIASLVLRNGGIEAAAVVMNEYLQRARSIIETYPESDYRNSLMLLCEYIGTRCR